MILSIIAPIFLLLGSGYLAVKSQLLLKEQISALGSFVMKIALPALFLQALASKEIHEIWHTRYFLSYSAVSLLLYGLAFYVMRRVFLQGFSQSAVLSLGAAMSNTGLIGTAVLTLLLGSKALTYTTLVVIVESVVIVPLVLSLAAMGMQQAKGLKILLQTFIGLLKNPLFLAVLMGIACAIFDVRLPLYVDQVLALLGQTASPIALFVIGAGMLGLSFKYVNWQSCYLVLSGNILMPLCMYLVLKYVADVSQEMLYVGTLIAALPMPSLYAMLGQAHGLQQQTLTPLLLSTILGFMISAGLIGLWWS